MKIKSYLILFSAVWTFWQTVPTPPNRSFRPEWAPSFWKEFSSAEASILPNLECSEWVNWPECCACYSEEWFGFGWGFGSVGCFEELRCSNEARIAGEAIDGGSVVAVAVALFAIVAIAEPLAQFAEPKNCKKKSQKHSLLKHNYMQKCIGVTVN